MPSTKGLATFENQPNSPVPTAHQFHPPMALRSKILNMGSSIEPNLFDSIQQNSIPSSIEDCVHLQVSAQCTKYGSREALVSKSDVITYSNLNNWSTALAYHLHRGGVRNNENVGFCFSKTVWTTVSTLAILKCGGCCVPLDPEYPHGRVKAILEAASIRFVLVERPQDILSCFEHVSQVVVDRRFLSGISKSLPDTNKLPDVKNTMPSSNAFVLFTSGSTGKPKGVILTHSAICSSAHYHGKAMLVGPDTRVYQHASYTFDMSIYDIYTTLIQGGTVCVPSSYDRLHRIPESIQELCADWVFFTPTLLAAIHPAEVPTLKMVLLAGESVNQELVDTWADKVHLFNGYGSTEMSTCFLAQLKKSSDPSAIGFPQGVIACIADVNNVSKPTCTSVGELVVAGPVLASGYLDNPKQTAASFSAHHDPFFRFYRTGDIVSASNDGSYRFLGRADTMVKIRGMRVELGEIEHNLMKCSAVKNAVVIYPRQGRFYEQLIAVVQPSAPLDHPEPCDLESLQKSLSRHLREVVSDYMMPNIWRFLPSMEMTVSGKIDRKAISERIQNESDVTPENAAKSAQPPTCTVTQAPSDALLGDTSTIDRSLTPMNASFLDLGLDSINLIGLSKILKKAYDLQFNVATLGMMSMQDLIATIQGSSEENEPKVQNTSQLHPIFSETFARLFQQINCPDTTKDMGNRQVPCSTLPDKRPLKILLTGATGFVGPYVIQSIFNSLPSNTNVVALVRARSHTDGLQSIITSLVRARIQLTPQQMGRLEIWMGDLSQPNIGVGSDELVRLKGDTDKSIDIVIHNGSVVDWSQAYEALELPNVISTISLLSHLRRRTRPAKIIYVSGGRMLEFATDPELGFAFNQNKAPSTSIDQVISSTNAALDLLEDQALPLVGYDISKIISESLVSATARLDQATLDENSLLIPRIVHTVRPGYIIGDTVSGYVKPSDYIWRVVATAILLQKRCSEAMDSWLYLAGADHVAQKITSTLLDDIGLNPKNPTEVNITTGMPIHEFWLTVSATFDVTLEIVAPDEWLYLVSKAIEEQHLDKHPLYPLINSHKADNGLLGLQRQQESKCEKDLQVVVSLQKSLVHLKEESNIFREWIGLM